MSIVRNDWNNELQMTADCLPIEKISDELTPTERKHLSHCLRCQTELALWKEVTQRAAGAEENAAVQSIAADLRRRNSSANVVSFSSRKRMWHPKALAAAAMLVLAIGVGYVVENREPAVNTRLGRNELYRSARIDSASPSGDVASAPSELQWAPVAGATAYDVLVNEVDGTVLWRATTRDARVPLPAALRAKFLEVKPIQWKVTARRDGTTLAESGTVQFRVAAGGR